MQTGSKDKILARIREALQTPAPPRHQGIPGETSATAASHESARAWLPPVPENLEQQLALLKANCRELKTEFIHCRNLSESTSALVSLAKSCGWKRAARHTNTLVEQSCRGLESEGINFTEIAAGYAVPDLESCDVGITGCEAVAVQTGSILVSPSSSGGRVLSVLPPHHVVIASMDQVVTDLQAAFDLVRTRHDGKLPPYLSFITGPSRTGDIERILVLGAHGPKRLTLCLIDQP